MKLKRLTCVVLALLAMLMSFAVSAAPIVESHQGENVTDTATVSPKAEETMWYYRIYNGHLQKRLWSLTRGIWLTEWEDC